MDNPDIVPGATPWRIIVPAEHDAAGDAAVDMAAALAGALHAELVLLGLSSPALATAPARSALGADGDPAEHELTQRVLDTSGRVPTGVQWRAVYGWEPAGPALVDAARDVEADLIVVPMRRGGELSHVVHDGADRHVLHHSAVPVLVVPEPEAVR